MQAYLMMQQHAQSLIDQAESLYANNQASMSDSTQLNNITDSLNELKKMGSRLSQTDQYKVATTFTGLESRLSNLKQRINSDQSRTQLMGGVASATTISEQEKLSQIQMDGAESIEFANRALQGLANQRGRLMGTMNTLDDIMVETNDAGSTVSKMISVQNRNKLIMWGIVGLLVFAICLIIYLQF